MKLPLGKERSGRWLGNALAMAVLVGICWGVEVVDQVFFAGSLDQMGIKPRSLDGLKGIALAPVLHGGFGHLLSNTVPMMILGWFVLLKGRGVFVLVTLAVTAIGGLGTWAVGASDSVHIGASGLIFGYLGFLIAGGVFVRSLRAIILAVAAGLMYGGMIWGVLPGQEGISWEGHLFGFLGGRPPCEDLRLIPRRLE